MIELVALDADDTLWHNEPLFRSAQGQFRSMLSQYHDGDYIDQRLYEAERRNLQHFGYGVKGFVLSMIETALDLTENRLEGADVRRILNWGRDMLVSPVELLDGVAETVRELTTVFRVILLTKGDLLHQESKLARSGLGEYFSGVEIVSEKDPRTYRAVMTRYRVAPERFVMVGNSLRSDVLPVLEAGGHAVHVPYPLTWALDEAPADAMRDVQYHHADRFADVPAIVRELSVEPRLA